MKVGIVSFLLGLCPSFLFAGGMGEISWMAQEAALIEMGISSPTSAVLVSQSFVSPDLNATLAVLTVLGVPANQSQNQEWTCVSQFVKTPEFFKVIKTECHK